MFIPGYALSLIFYPKKDDLPISSRITFSFAFSITSVIIIVLFIDKVIAMKTTPSNIVFSIIIFTITALLIWKIELRINNNKDNKLNSIIKSKNHKKNGTIPQSYILKKNAANKSDHNYDENIDDVSFREMDDPNNYYTNNYSEIPEREIKSEIIKEEFEEINFFESGLKYSEKIKKQEYRKKEEKETPYYFSGEDDDKLYI